MYHRFAFAPQFDTVRHLQQEQTSQTISERTDLLQGMFLTQNLPVLSSDAIESILTFSVKD